jgi:hypothetical protein
MPRDTLSGARITRLSGSSIRTENIYCEAPRASADGQRFVSQRYIDHLLSPVTALLCHDLGTKFTCLLDPEVVGIPVAPAWSGSLYYQRGSMLMRASLQTCETQTVMDLTPLPPCWMLTSVSADQRYLVYTTATEEVPQSYNLVRIDLRTHVWKYLLDQPEPSRCLANYNPVAGHGMLITKTFWEGQHRCGVIVLADGEGRSEKKIMSHMHHHCWLGNTGKFAGLANFDPETFRHRPEHPEGEMYIYSSDGTPPRLISAPEHLFYHISSSPCGRYVVCESLESGLDLSPVPIVVVNVETGRHRVLVSDAKCSHGGDAGRQVNPYFTADLRHVIYNADPDGVVNVFAAEIPEGFLDGLN